MENIKSLDTLSFESLFIAFNKAFSDYEIQVNSKELRVMLSRRGFVPSLSFGLFEEDKLIAFTLNGIGEFNGEKTAYDTGTGTLKEYRGRGLATALLAEALKYNRHHAVKMVNTEISCKNITAFMNSCGIPLKGTQFEMIKKW